MTPSVLGMEKYRARIPKSVCADEQNRGHLARRFLGATDVAIQRQENVMDKNRIEGTKHEVKGAVKEAVGKVTGNPTKEAAGHLEKEAGKLQKDVGKARDDYKKH